MLGTNAKPRAVVASAKRVKLNRWDKVGKPWQEPLWDIYEHLGPVHYGMTFKQNAAQRVNFFVAELVDDEDEPVPTDNPTAVEALDRLGDVSALVGDFVVQENVAGEGYLYGKGNSEPQDVESFEVLSTVEVAKRRAANENSITGDDYLLRVWRRSPRYRDDPDSPLRSVQDQCEQLMLLNDEIGATAMSRIPAGFLLVADELSFASPAEDPPADGANMDNDPFMAEVIEIMTEAITDANAAGRVAPNVIRGPHELLKDGFVYVDVGRKMDETFAKMRDELLRQIAGGINLPAEILTGLADLNHWSLWGVDESTAKHHVDPDVLHILAGLTEGYLWPYLQEAGVSDFKQFVIWRDYSDLTSRPLTVEQAVALNQEGIINDEYVRMVANIPDKYAGTGQTQVSNEVITDPRANQDPPENIAAAAPIRLTDLADIDARLSTRVIEASEAAFTRALEKAGARVRAKARKDRNTTAAIDGVPDSDVTRHLGAERVEALQVTNDFLLPDDTFDTLRKRTDEHLRRAQDETYLFLSVLLGIELARTPRDDEDRDKAVDLFIAALFAAATLRLFTSAPDIDPAETGEFGDEIATGQMVFELLTRAGGADIKEFTPETPRGLALGQRTRAILRDHGYQIESETWEYGDISLRRFPYEPHVALDGAQVLDREDPRLGGYYPGDHRYCRCRWVPSVLPIDEVG